MAYVVKVGASLAEFNSLNKEPVAQWLDHFVSRETIPNEKEGDVDKQIDPRLWRAADMYVLMDQPDTALAHLAALLPKPEAARRIVELLNLFDPLDLVALEIRAQVANAMN